jgi:hypothetical protein
MSQGNFTVSYKGNKKLEFKGANISNGIHKGIADFESLVSSQPLPLSESLASSMPVSGLALLRLVLQHLLVTFNHYSSIVPHVCTFNFFNFDAHSGF